MYNIEEIKKATKNKSNSRKTLQYLYLVERNKMHFTLVWDLQ